MIAFFIGDLCLDYNNTKTHKVLCNDCKVAPLDKRRNAHLLLYMIKDSDQEHLLKEKVVNTPL